MGKLRILIVEDTPSHLRDARRVLEEVGVEILTADTASSGIRLMSNYKDGTFTPRVDGVLTDIFLPQESEPPRNKADQPCGLAVALRAEDLGIPFVMCTAGNHHGDKYDWICTLGRRRGWPEIVDRHDPSDFNAEAETKDWAEAWQLLEAAIERKQTGT